MTQNLPSSSKRPELFPADMNNNNVFNSLTPSLTDKQREELAMVVASKKVSLDEHQRKAEINHIIASVEMGQAIQAVDVLDKTTKDDYKFNQSFTTGSGQANIQVQRNRNYAGMILLAVGLAGLCLLILIVAVKLK